MNTFDALDLDPFTCAELLTLPVGQAATPTIAEDDWARCTSCTDPGFDHDEFRWPEPSKPSAGKRK